MDTASIDRMCAGKVFKVQGAETEKAREEKLLVMRFVLEKRKDLDGR